MSFIASLDIGSEKMVMAVAEAGVSGSCRLVAIKMIVSQGVKNGVVVDKARVKSYIQYLINELAKGKRIDSLKVALSGEAVKVKDQKVNVPVQRKAVAMYDLNRAEDRCVEQFNSKEQEVVDLLPLVYAVDRGDFVTDPLGMQGRNLEAWYKAYVAERGYLDELREMFAGLGMEQVDFFPETRAYLEVLGERPDKKDAALIDMGAMSTKVVLFGNGMLKKECVLPLGAHTIDLDIMSVEALKMDDVQKAKKLKHEHGEAVRSAAKNEKVDLPEMKLRIDRRDLSKVIQCRLEELLEGAIFQLQQWHFNDPNRVIMLTGGGSRMKNIDVLLGKLSGHRVDRARVSGVVSGNEELLESPTCLTALGLLLCEHEETEEEKGHIGGWFSNIFK